MEKHSKVLQKILIRPILWYRYLLSPWVGRHCRFEPTCSQYAITAIQTYGCLKGLRLTLFRILRCHPFCQGGYDPVPENFPIKNKMN